MEPSRIETVLLVLLAVMVIIPFVSAGTEDPLPDGRRVHEIPSDYPQNSTPAQWIPEEGMINIVISRETLEDLDQDTRPGIISIPVSGLDLKTVFKNTPENPSFFIQTPLTPEEDIVLLRMPKIMFEGFLQKATDGTLSLPATSFFRNYESIRDLQTHIKMVGHVLEVYRSDTNPCKNCPLKVFRNRNAHIQFPVSHLKFPEHFDQLGVITGW